MRLIAFILLIPFLSFGQSGSTIPFGNGRPIDTARTWGSCRIDSVLVLPKYKTADSNKVLGIGSDGRAVLRTKGNTDTTSLSNRINQSVKYSDSVIGYASTNSKNNFRSYYSGSGFGTVDFWGQSFTSYGNVSGAANSYGVKFDVYPNSTTTGRRWAIGFFKRGVDLGYGFDTLYRLNIPSMTCGNITVANGSTISEGFVTLTIQNQTGLQVSNTNSLYCNAATFDHHTAGAGAIVRFRNGTGDVVIDTFSGGNTYLGSTSLSIGSSVINIASGTNKSVDDATLSGGTVTVANTSVTSNSRIWISAPHSASNNGAYSVVITPGTGFVINSTNVLDASTVTYEIKNKQ
jgi:hypothetical protein